MKTKEEILEQRRKHILTITDRDAILDSMDEYAREHTLAFLKYWEQYRNNMSELAMKERMEGRGLPTWDDRPETVYELFLKSLSPSHKPAQ